MSDESAQTPADQRPPAQRPSDYARLRLSDARKKKGWSQRDLAQAMADAGWPIDRTIIARIESGTGRAENLTVNELVAFAAVLGMSPLWLIAPWDDDARVSIAPDITSRGKDFRLWVQGLLPLNFDWASQPEGGARAERLAASSDRKYFEYMQPATAGEADVDE